MITKEKIYAIGLIIALFIIGELIFKSCQDNKIIREVKRDESNLRKALADTLTHFQTKEGDWGVEKKTLQTDIESLKDKNLVLNENQKLLIKEVDRQNKTAQTFAAALIELKAEVAGIKNDKPVSVTDTSATFAQKLPDFEYDITIDNVRPLKTPTLHLNKISFPNKQTINFHWKDDKKEGYPVAFSVINSNQYFKVNDIQSYAIPEISKTQLKPTFFNKLGNFSKTTGGKIVFFTAGLAIGFVIAK